MRSNEARHWQLHQWFTNVGLRRKLLNHDLQLQNLIKFTPSRTLTLLSKNQNSPHPHHSSQPGGKSRGHDLGFNMVHQIGASGH